MLGSLVLAIYLLHGANHMASGQVQQMLWVCNVGLLGIAVGWLLAAPRVLATGCIWLALGTPLWLYGAIAEFGFQASSVLAHFGGLSLGVLGLHSLGLPRGTWWTAALATLPLMLVSRLFTPGDQNVNMAHRPWPGWEGVFPSHLLFLLLFYAAYVAALFGIEAVARRLGLSERSEPVESPSDNGR